ncbi:MAG: class I SAM-dependent methyltransferase [Caldilineaceae bacterium]|nr:class I SAM-dependent methyltransferase [Caldilineaceae bacterium]
MQDDLNLTPPPQLNQIEAATAIAGFTLASDRLTGALLRTLAATKPGGKLLELGTGSGLSTAWILDGMSADATLDTVDNDAKIQAIAKTHLGNDARLTIHTQDGDSFIRSLTAAQKHFDFIFADTWPGKLRLLEETLALLNAGGLYIVDDMLPQPNWTTLDLGYDHPAAIRSLTATLEALLDFHVTKLSWATGIIIATRRAAWPLNHSH